jgi:hypothetical protein
MSSNPAHGELKNLNLNVRVFIRIMPLLGSICILIYYMRWLAVLCLFCINFEF